MPRFRKKPVVIDAFRIRREGPTPTPDWFTEALMTGNVWYQGGEDFYFTIKTLEGEMRANIGDWIIRGVQGELYPCKPDIFEATYELVDET